MSEGVSSLAVGLGACAVSSLTFGTQFVPVKLVETRVGLGVGVQWASGVGIWLVGLAVTWARGWPPWEPLAMLGGALWALGNVTAVPIVRELGMALGLLLWGFTNLLFGWASGRFGWFGLRPQPPASDLLNGLGLALSLLSTIMFGLIKNKPAELGSGYEEAGEDERTGLLEKRPPWWTPRRIAAVGAALAAGSLYGLSFAPVIYVEDIYAGASRNGLDHLLPFTSGVLLTTTLVWVGWEGWGQWRGRAEEGLGRAVLLAGLASGLLWGLGEAAWFVANDALSEAVSFPIVTRFPGLVAALWGVFYFREIQGKRNLWILGAAIVITVIGGVLSGLSKVIET